MNSNKLGKNENRAVMNNQTDRNSPKPNPNEQPKQAELTDEQREAARKAEIDAGWAFIAQHGME